MGGWNPLEQVAARDGEPDQRAQDGVSHQPSLVRQEDDHQAGLQQRETQLPARSADVAGERNARAAPGDLRQYRDQRRQNDRREDEAGPDDRILERQRPSSDQGQNHSRR